MLSTRLLETNRVDRKLMQSRKDGQRSGKRIATDRNGLWKDMIESCFHPCWGGLLARDGLIPFHLDWKNGDKVLSHEENTQFGML